MKTTPLEQLLVSNRMCGLSSDKSFALATKLLYRLASSGRLSCSTSSNVFLILSSVGAEQSCAPPRRNSSITTAACLRQASFSKLNSHHTAPGVCFADAHTLVRVDTSQPYDLFSSHLHITACTAGTFWHTSISSRAPSLFVPGST